MSSTASFAILIGVVERHAVANAPSAVVSLLQQTSQTQSGSITSIWSRAMLRFE